MDGYSWLILDLDSDNNIIIEYSEDFTYDELVSVIRYPTESINEYKLKVVTGMTERKAKAMQKKLTNKIQETFFVFA